MDRPPRIMLVSIGEPGHAFPVIAIASKLVAAGCEVAVHTWFRWEDHIAGIGAKFFRAPKFEVVDGDQIPDVQEAAVLATEQLTGVIEEWRPDLIVGDVLTLAGSLSAELCAVPFVTFVPHFWHATGPESVPFGSGWAPARSPLAKLAFRAIHRLERVGLEYGRDELNETRRRVGLSPLDRVHGALSENLILVGTFPQLEPERDWPEHVKVVGPVMWEPPSDRVELPGGDLPLVVVGPSTAQDLQHEMLTAAVEGLRDLPIRVLAAKNGREPPRPLHPGPNTVVADWIPYSQAFPVADVVVCHGGHGTVLRAITSRAALVICPASGDQYENAARVRWAKVGVSVPKPFINAGNIAAAVEKVLGDPGYRTQVDGLADWAETHDGAQVAADEILAFADSLAA
jgi:MGT family glycosyltransferase